MKQSRGLQVPRFCSTCDSTPGDWINTRRCHGGKLAYQYETDGGSAEDGAGCGVSFLDRRRHWI
jgi:hypothetical protein